MIKFRLRCGNGHEFDSLFDNSDAFERLSKAKKLMCDRCGNHDIQKGIMAPAIRSSDKAQRLAELEAVEMPSLHDLPFVGDLREVVDAAHDGDKDAQQILKQPVAGTVSSSEDLMEVAKHGEVYILGEAEPKDITPPEKPARRLSASARPSTKAAANSNIAKKPLKKNLN